MKPLAIALAIGVAALSAPVVAQAANLPPAGSGTIAFSPTTPNPPDPLLYPVEFTTTGIKGLRVPLLNVREYEQPAGVCGELVWDHTASPTTYYNPGEGSYINPKGESCYATVADYDLVVRLFYFLGRSGRGQWNGVGEPGAEVVLAEREFETTDIVP